VEQEDLILDLHPDKVLVEEEEEFLDVGLQEIILFQVVMAD